MEVAIIFIVVSTIISVVCAVNKVIYLRAHKAAREKIILWILLYGCVNLFGCSIVYFMFWLNDRHIKTGIEVFQEYYSSIEFEGRIISNHKTNAWYGRKELILCVDIVETNTYSFFRYDKNIACLRIENGIAAFPFDPQGADIGDFSYIKVNKNQNNLIVFSNEDGEEKCFSLSQGYNASTKVLDLWVCE